MALDEMGKPITGTEEPLLERSQIYAYRVSTRAIVPVTKPEAIKSDLFRINRVSSDGYLEIISEGPPVAQASAVRWFRIHGR